MTGRGPGEGSRGKQNVDRNKGGQRRCSPLNQNEMHIICQGCCPGSAGGAMAPPDSGRSVGRLCPPNNTGTPSFSDLPKAL